MDDETKHEKLLKRLQLWIAVLAGATTLVIGAYNIKNIFFPKKEVEKVIVQAPPPETHSSSMKSAVEEVGAAWIKELGAPKRKKDES